MTYFVSRDGLGVVAGLFGSRQPGVADESLDETHPDVQTFLGPTTTRILRDGASTLVSAIGPLPQVIRGVLLAILGETNRLRDRLTAQDAAVAAAVSLADLKNRWASLALAAPLPDVTPAQVKQAVVNQIQGGSAD